ncbi:hypothetical protein BJ878DRAFT_422546 [Calycina marina]|uniref:Autophagy-related protein 2 n=1 Tax=Calycina marina TaxID=1763456 RepID=A0A9P7Z268_9HELO|nr:hypothetical protein BJ878DRAFT_422546 [Calycina marina]
MASYLQSFLANSSMPKRLLHYALSRLEIIDTDALDLENLEISWGTQNKFEFTDIGLRLKKLESLLQLPSTFELVQARILLLRVTVPVNITSGQLQVEVEGVECEVRVKDIHNARTNHDRKRQRKTSGARDSQGPNVSRRRDSRIKDDDTDSTILTAADLAQSFLQTEPAKEKAELEAALMSDNHDPEYSSILSDDEEIPMGTGTALSVPDWIARLIQGVVDRLEIRIRGVSVNLNVEVYRESDSLQIASTPATDLLTVQLKIESVDIEGVGYDLEGMRASEASLKPGKRLVSLEKIRGALISDANLFTTLARSSALSSSVSHSDVFNQTRDGSKSQTSAGTNSSGGPSSPELNLASLSLPPSARYQQETSDGRHRMHSSTITTDSGRFEDAAEDEAHMLVESVRPESEPNESVLQDSAYLNQLTDSQFEGEEAVHNSHLSAHHIEETHRLKHLQDSPSSTPSVSVPLWCSEDHDVEYLGLVHSNEAETPEMLQSVIPARPHPRFLRERTSLSQTAIPEDMLPTLVTAPSVGSAAVACDGSECSDEEDGTSTHEDLAQSQLFSHEDAESMYMSALSHGSEPMRVPGGWSDSSSDSTGGRSMRAQQEPLDNSEHAGYIVSDPTSTGPEGPRNSNPPVKKSSHPELASRISPTASQQVRSAPQSSSGISEPSTSSDEYSRLSKQIFHIDQASIYLPANHAKASAEPHASENPVFSGKFDGSASQSISVEVPGAFSPHLPAKGRKPFPSDLTPPPARQSHVEASGTDNAIELNIGNISGRFDISVGRLIWRLVSSLNQAFEQDASPNISKSEDKPPGYEFRLKLEQFSLQFLGSLQGVLVASNHSETIPWVDAPEQEVLLCTRIQGLSVDTHAHNAVTETEVQMQKIVFGYARENILSFDADLQMRSSVRDLQASAGIDASVKITTSMGTTRFDVNTLPLHISIDLQRLDETFSWFGGLSSVLNLGSSIASNSTITAITPSKSKPRSVRFDTSESPEPALQAAKTKAGVRIGGLILDLLGTECSIGVETSAVKIISRGAVTGLGVQKISLSGPHIKKSHSHPAITVDVIGTRIEFLQEPKDIDLDTLLSLITPSKAKYDQDDDILLDTLLRQRQQGSVLRLTVDELQTRIGRLEELNYLPELGEEVARLSTVAKYLSEDDRPGLLSLIKVKKFDARVDVDRNIGIMKLAAKNIDVAQITFPSLVALSISTLTLHRNGSEELIIAATDPESREPRLRSPAVMARMIGDEMEPIVKVKLWNLKVEYRVPTLIALLNLADNATGKDISEGLAASVMTLTDLPRSTAPQPISSSSTANPLTIDIVLRDCILGLNPINSPAKVLVVMTEAHLSTVMPKDGNASANGELDKASLLIIDNVTNITSGVAPQKSRRESFDGGNSQLADLCGRGFVSISYISSARAVVQVITDQHGDKSVDIELRDDLFVLESCADSTQTLVAALNGLSPPTAPSTEVRYRTKVIPVADLLASLSGDAFGTAEGTYNIDDDFAIPDDILEDSEDFDLDFQHYTSDNYQDGVFADDNQFLASSRVTIQDTNDGVLLGSFTDSKEVAEETEELNFQENHFGNSSILEGTAHRWNSTKNTYDKSNASKVRKSPLKVCVRDVHIIWNLFDGYDWQHTRDAIAKAVQDVQSKAIERRARSDKRPSFEQDLGDDETVIGDFLFNSIYIGIPGNRDPRELPAAINQELNDNATETESIATTSLSSSPNRQGGARRGATKQLRLKRSKHHKITFELKGVCVDLVAFPKGSGETQSSIDIRVRDFEIFDHVPTSTWRKFATYMQEAGERETGMSQIHIEILNVKPVPQLAASEIVLKAAVLPLRLHVDQDALDFITRFFEFKEDWGSIPSSPGDVPFLQRVEVNSIQVKLDFKPKRVDYAGLRSGHTTEFMNFLILDEADMVLRHTIIYGISGFDKLGQTLNDIWMPEIKRNQLPGILAGLAPVRSLVNVGGGLQQLVVVPMREYKKDGRIVRSISKGAAAFAKTTGTELVKLGAKVAVGVQTVLQGAEGLLNPSDEPMQTGLEDDDESEESKQISLYANQPVGVLQGLRGGYSGLQRDLVMARDAIIAVPGEVMEGGNAAGVLKAVRRHAPTVILRPAIGMAKAGGQILMGATNTLDPANLQKADAVSFPFIFPIYLRTRRDKKLKGPLLTCVQKYKRH